MERLAHILMTDIHRSSYLWEAFPDIYPGVLQRHNQLVEQAVADHAGAILKGMGDGYIALFDSAAGSLDCAIELQSRLSGSFTFPDGTPLLIRTICHGGVLHQLTEGDWFGNALNRAARICQVCHPGQLLVSRFVADGAQRTTGLIDLGLHRLRDLAEPEHLLQVVEDGFSIREFPPLVSLSSRPNNLALQPNAFVGRAQELDELTVLVRDSTDVRLVTIVAPGGYGKSRLAAQLCANLLDRFPAGVFEVLLAPVEDSARVPVAIAEAVGLRLTGIREPHQQLADYLAERELLLHLDNFEHLAESAGAISELLAAAPKLKLVVTSRQPLRLRSEQVYQLHALPTAGQHSPAVQLFIDRAQLVRHDFEPRAEELPLIGEICAKLEGVPLAIEMAAAWVDVFTLPELMVEVGAQLELAARLGDVPERHRSVRASLDWSWGLLTPQQQAILRRLATFRGGFLLEAAQAVLANTDGIGGFALRARLAELVDKSWLYTREEYGAVRFFMRDAAAREYAGEQLATSADDQAARLAHATYFSEIVGREGAKMYRAAQPEAMRTFRAERNNIYRAADVLIEARAVEQLRPMIGNLYYFQDAAGLNIERVDLYTRFVEVGRRSEDKPLLARALLGLAMGHWRMGEADRAELLVEEALDIANATGDRDTEADALHNLASVYYARSQYTQALEQYKTALEALRRLDAPGALARALFNYANAQNVMGERESATATLSECRLLCEAEGFLHTLALTIRSEAMILIDKGQPEAAMTRLEECLEISESMDNVTERAEVLLLLAFNCNSLGRYSDGVRLVSEAEQLTKQFGLIGQYAQALEFKCVLLYSQGEHNEALSSGLQAIDLYKRSGKTQRMASTLGYLALISSRQNRLAEAAIQASQGLELATRYAYPLLTLQLVKCGLQVLVNTMNRPQWSALLQSARALLHAGNYPFDPVEKAEFAALEALADTQSGGELPLSELILEIQEQLGSSAVEHSSLLAVQD